MENKKKTDFKKHILPILLLVAVVLFGLLFKDEQPNSADISGYTYEASQSMEGSYAEELPDLTDAATTTDTADTTTAATEASTAPTEATAPPDEQAAPTEESSNEVEILYYFRSQQQYEQHYDKHGHEFTPIFGEITMEEYLMYANALIQSEDEEILTKTEKEDGDFMYFRPSTEEFLVLSTDGYIRTYFIPTAGIDYWNRQ